MMIKDDQIDFDDFAEAYENLCQSSVRIGGESDQYFDRNKVECLKRWHKGLRQPARVLDFGCGIGKLSALIARTFPHLQVTGYDISAKSIELARHRWAVLDNIEFFSGQWSENQSYDLVIASNVFHHIAPPERRNTLERLTALAGESGRICIFEHNPYNPVTRYVVKSCPYDRGVSLVRRSALIKMAHKVGLEVEKKKYIVFFPSMFRLLRPLEPGLAVLPMGAQYMVILKTV